MLQAVTAVFTGCAKTARSSGKLEHKFFGVKGEGLVASHQTPDLTRPPFLPDNQIITRSPDLLEKLKRPDQTRSERFSDAENGFSTSGRKISSGQQPAMSLKPQVFLISHIEKTAT